MKAPDIARKAHAMGVRLRIDGDMVKLRGPADAVAAIKPEVAAHKREVMAYLRQSPDDSMPVPPDCDGALRSVDGGLFLPWGAYLSPDDVRRTLAELAGTIEQLAALERWPQEQRDDVLTRALRGPLGDMLPNHRHFSEMLAAACAEAEAREIAARRAWRANADLSRRGYR
ncbi:hypothetical protein [Burkholderia sp. Ac-20353]|uniref:hypothetical protein n=1 Tax=Burkholderia sp. Ac-20353 TaxID=2703894 RepID=UPI00197B2977|nr:hypothetical protein [Burkholderia sp. Ac-20353]MBN3789308.1 hypothetical protein [Burkholderia sp. Ac-20353]